MKESNCRSVLQREVPDMISLHRSALHWLREMAEDWVLCLYPRSGLGFKYRLQLNNTVGIIDSDYFYSDNEGHMFMKLTNDSKEGKTLELGQGEGMVQGIFMQYGITEDDDADGVRNGGFGSTTGK